MDDYLREMIEQSAFENLTSNIKSLINKGQSFDEACYMLDVDDKTRDIVLETGMFKLN